MFCAITLSKSNPTPLYIQLATELTKLIKDGSIPEKTKLPTIRFFSHSLKINRDTVVSAYKLLENQGLIIAQVGSGTYVAPVSPSYALAPVLPPISCSSISFSKNLFPISLCKELLNNVLAIEGWSAFSDPLYRERNLIYQSISHYLKSIGIPSPPTQIRLIKDFYMFLVDLLEYAPSSSICVEAYHDLTYSSFLRSLGIKMIEVPLEADGMNLNSLEQHLQTSQVGFIWISSYIQNPTGLSYSLEKKVALLELAKKYHCFIIEDATLSDFFESPTPPTSLFSLSSYENVICLYHFSKFYLPELCYTFVALPQKLIKSLPDKLECTLNERILHAYLDSRILTTLKKELITSNSLKHKEVLKHLLASPKLSQVFTHEGALFFWITPTSCTISQVCDYFLSHHIVISPGDLFSSKSHINAFRLSIANLTEETLQTLLMAIDLF